VKENKGKIKRRKFRVKDKGEREKKKKKKEETQNVQPFSILIFLLTPPKTSITASSHHDRAPQPTMIAATVETDPSIGSLPNTPARDGHASTLSIV
jgi:hypothetical protein